MSTIIIAAILIAVIASISLILVVLNNKHRQKTTPELLKHFSKLGTENNLSFSSQEILENCIIGLDGIQRKLLILKRIEEDIYDSILLDLNEIKSCLKKKIYKTVNMGTSKKERFEKQIEKIVLVFEFTDSRQPVHITFFEPIANHIFTMSELEQRARNWETMLSQLVNTGLKKIA